MIYTISFVYSLLHIPWKHLTITHYNVLRMIEGFYDLPLAGASANATPIADAVR